MDLFLSFNGRIARGQWWIGVIVLFVALLIASFIIAALFGTGFFGSLLTFALSVAALYPAVALATKRLADRGKPAMPRVALFYGPGLLSSLMATFGIGYRPMNMGQLGGAQMPGMETMMVPGLLATLVGFATLVAFVWAIIELGILRGDAQANAYGPPPQ
ncbi:MAG: DUF805 domain-containing protein [Pararhodobacter sp.]|nr:DUF805 domain-containing protein [Pararhodobacter sp.]